MKISEHSEEIQNSTTWVENDDLFKEHSNKIDIDSIISTVRNVQKSQRKNTYLNSKDSKKPNENVNILNKEVKNEVNKEVKTPSISEFSKDSIFQFEKPHKNEKKQDIIKKIFLHSNSSLKSQTNNIENLSNIKIFKNQKLDHRNDNIIHKNDAMINKNENLINKNDYVMKKKDCIMNKKDCIIHKNDYFIDNQSLNNSLLESQNNFKRKSEKNQPWFDGIKTYKFLTDEQKRKLEDEFEKRKLKYTKDNVRKVSRELKIPINRALVFVYNKISKTRIVDGDPAFKNCVKMADILVKLEKIVKKSKNNMKK